MHNFVSVKLRKKGPCVAFCQIEIISLQDRALKADYNGTFSLAMRCSVVML